MIKICEQCGAKHHDHIPKNCKRCGLEFDGYIPVLDQLIQRFTDYVNEERWDAITPYFNIQTPLPTEVMDILKPHAEKIPGYPKKTKKKKKVDLQPGEVPDKINTSKEVLITMTPKQKELALEAGGIVKGRRLRLSYCQVEDLIQKLGDKSAPARKLVAEIKSNKHLIKLGY